MTTTRQREAMRRYMREWPTEAQPLAETIVWRGKATRRRDNINPRSDGRSALVYSKARDMQLFDMLPPAVRHAINYASWTVLAHTAYTLGVKHEMSPLEMAKRIRDYGSGITPGSPSLAEFEAVWVDGGAQ